MWNVTHLLGVGGEFFKLNVMKKLLPLLLILVGCQTINLEEEKAEQSEPEIKEKSSNKQTVEGEYEKVEKEEK